MARKKTTIPAFRDRTDVFTSPESSNVEGGTYDRTTKSALIAFRDKKDPSAITVFYSYKGPVAEADWDGLVNAESKGKYMSAFKKKYKGVKVG